MNIKEYQIENEEALLDVMSLLIPDYFAESELADFKEYLVHDLEYYYVVELEERLVGAGGFNVLEKSNTVRISWDFVHPEFQGHGIGKELIAYRLKRIGELYPKYKIEVRTSQMAYVFYEKQGFVLQDVVENYWAEGFDLYAMYLIKE